MDTTRPIVQIEPQIASLEDGSFEETITVVKKFKTEDLDRQIAFFTARIADLQAQIDALTAKKTTAASVKQAADLAKAGQVKQ